MAGARTSPTARVVGGRVVRTPDAEQPYKVVLEHADGLADSEHPVRSVRDGELLIRRRSPARPRPETMREWNIGLPSNQDLGRL
jgi:hypothetical protein